MADVCEELGGAGAHSPQLLQHDQHTDQCTPNVTSNDNSSDITSDNAENLNNLTLSNSKLDIESDDIKDEIKEENSNGGGDVQPRFALGNTTGSDEADGGAHIGFTLGAESKNEIMDSLAFTLKHSENNAGDFPDLEQDVINLEDVPVQPAPAWGLPPGMVNFFY